MNQSAGRMAGDSIAARPGSLCTSGAVVPAGAPRWRIAARRRKGEGHVVHAADGMSTLAAKTVRAEVGAVDVHFTSDMIHIALSDGRELGLPLSLPWLGWLVKATPAQRERWSLEPRGFAVYWEELDDGIEVAPLLRAQPL